MSSDKAGCKKNSEAGICLRTDFIDHQERENDRNAELQEIYRGFIQEHASKTFSLRFIEMYAFNAHGGKYDHDKQIGIGSDAVGEGEYVQKLFSEKQAQEASNHTCRYEELLEEADTRPQKLTDKEQKSCYGQIENYVFKCHKGFLHFVGFVFFQNEKRTAAACRSSSS